MRARFFEVRKDPFLLGVRTNIELERREVAHVEPDELERATHLALVDALSKRPRRESRRVIGLEVRQL